MEGIRVEVTLPEEFLQQLEERIKKSVAEALQANIQAIKQDQTKLTREEAAKKLRISLPTLSKHIKSGLIKSQQIGKRVLIPESEIEQFLKQSA
jgi:excisionase family DNA binding protein